MAALWSTPLKKDKKLRRVQEEGAGQKEETGQEAPLAKGRVLIVCAMEEEARYVRDRMRNHQELPLAHVMRRTRGTLLGAPDSQVDLIVCGIGTIYASMALTAVLLHAERSREPYAAILNCGCSGAHQVRA